MTSRQLYRTEKHRLETMLALAVNGRTTARQALLLADPTQVILIGRTGKVRKRPMLQELKTTRDVATRIAREYVREQKHSKKKVRSAEERYYNIMRNAYTKVAQSLTAVESIQFWEGQVQAFQIALDIIKHYHREL